MNGRVFSYDQGSDCTFTIKGFITIVNEIKKELSMCHAAICKSEK